VIQQLKNMLINNMSPEERKAAFEYEILHLIIYDGKIDQEEKLILDSIAPLYFFPEEANITVDEWDSIADRLQRRLNISGNEQKIDKDKNNFYLFRNIVKRLLEPGHKNLPQKNFHWLCDWLSLQHDDTMDYWKLPEYKHCGDMLLPNEFQIFPQNLELQNSPSGKISNSYDEWKKKPIPTDPVIIKVDESAVFARVEVTLQKSAEGSVLNELDIMLQSTKSLLSKMAFPLEEGTQVKFIDVLEANQEVWFAGDVHGDLLAFEAACDCFERYSSENAKFVFLGDFIDRGVYDLEVIHAFLKRVSNSPQKYAWIVGNHDLGLTYSTDCNCFESRTSPAEFTDWLNSRKDDANIARVGKNLIELVKFLPRAIFFPGLLAAHAGFPHSDLWDELKTKADFSSLDSINDFVHNRIHLSKRKMPNRSSFSSQFGSADFMDFREVCNQLGIKLDSMIRGHDHIADSKARWVRPGKMKRGNFEYRVLTINTLCYNQSGEINPYTEQNPRYPTIAKWKAGEILPTPYVIKLSAEIVNQYAKPCSNCGKPRIENTCTCNYIPGKAI